jgi:hypothetical protein
VLFADSELRNEKGSFLSPCLIDKQPNLRELSQYNVSYYIHTIMIESNCNIQLSEDDDLFLLSRDEFSPSPSSLELDLGGSNPDSFPAVLHGIVSDESSNDCIHWLPCGTHFTISDKEKVRFLHVLVFIA